MSLERAFADGPAFVPYLVAGDPDPDATVAYVEALVEGGADAVELGLPFSEPIAEGQTIQSAIVRALEGGMTPEGFFDLVERIDVDAPLVVMTYYNLIHRYGRGGIGDGENASADAAVGAADGEAGVEVSDQEAGVEAFVARAAAAGIDGVIVPDLPVEESDPLRRACDRHGMDLVYIVAPTTRGERIDRVLDRASGFLYVQARLGTTGAREDVSERTATSLERFAGSDLPRAVGFGISEGEHAERVVAAGADGVIVGSAVVDIVGEGVREDLSTGTVADRLREKARELKRGAERGHVPDASEPEAK